MHDNRQADVQTMCSHTIVPVDLLGRSLNGQLSSINGDGVNLNPITSK